MLDSLTILFPAYNDENTIGGLVADAFLVCPELAHQFKVIVVNDGSQDGTAQVLESLKTCYGDLLCIITHKKNRGYGGALRSGFAANVYDWLFYTDGDGQYDVKQLPRLVNAWSPNLDVVNGYIAKRHDAWHRRFIGKCYNGLLHAMFKLPIRDIDCDFRLLRGSLLKQLNLMSISGTICIEMIVKLKELGAQFAETEIQHFPRLHGRSQFFQVNHLLSTLKQFLKLIWFLKIKKNEPQNLPVDRIATPS